MGPARAWPGPRRRRSVMSTQTATTVAAPHKRLLEHMPPLAALGPLVALLFACIFFASQSDRFLSGQNFSLILQQVMVVGVVALGSIVMTKFAVDYGMNAYLAILCGLLVSALFGLLNGSLITFVRLPAFI